MSALRLRVRHDHLVLLETVFPSGVTSRQISRFAAPFVASNIAHLIETMAASESKNHQDDVAMEDAEAPTTRPFEHHPAELIPDKILQAYPNGSPSNIRRSPEHQASVERKGNDLARKMTLPELQNKYREIASEIVERVEDNERRDREWEDERGKKVQEHEMEAKALKKMLSALQED